MNWGLTETGTVSTPVPWGLWPPPHPCPLEGKGSCRHQPQCGRHSWSCLLTLILHLASSLVIWCFSLESTDPCFWLHLWSLTLAQHLRVESREVEWRVEIKGGKHRSPEVKIHHFYLGLSDGGVFCHLCVRLWCYTWSVSLQFKKEKRGLPWRSSG